MKFALVIREQSYELNLSPNSIADQAVLQLIYNAAVKERGAVEIRASHSVSGELPARLWITIRKTDDGAGPIVPEKPE